MRSGEIPPQKCSEVQSSGYAAEASNGGIAPMNRLRTLGSVEKKQFDSGSRPRHSPARALTARLPSKLGGARCSDRGATTHWFIRQMAGTWPSCSSGMVWRGSKARGHRHRTGATLVRTVGVSRSSKRKPNGSRLARGSTETAYSVSSLDRIRGSLCCCLVNGCPQWCYCSFQ